MTDVTFHPLPTAIVEMLRAGGPDANRLPAEKAVSEGTGMPCRHCLNNIPDGAAMLILAHRPFATRQPYAEAGPIFLCARSCEAHTGTDLPPILRTSAGYLLKGYTVDERIRYGTGKIVPPEDIKAYAASLLDATDSAFVDMRLARNNCFMTRITAA